jgi:hypothetical protein
MPSSKRFIFARFMDTRSLLNGLLWILGTGAQRRELLSQGRKLERILRQLAGELHVRGRLKFDEAFVDATFASAKKRAWRLGQRGVGKGTKILAVADVRSLPLAVSVQGASPHESQLVEEGLAHSFLDTLPQRLIGDSVRQRRW